MLMLHINTKPIRRYYIVLAKQQLLFLVHPCKVGLDENVFEQIRLSHKTKVSGRVVIERSQSVDLWYCHLKSYINKKCMEFFILAKVNPLNI